MLAMRIVNDIKIKLGTIEETSTNVLEVFSIFSQLIFFLSLTVLNAELSKDINFFNLYHLRQTQ